MPTSLQDASRAIDAEWQAAWNDGHDMSRMAALLTPDVDFVNVLGSHWNGSAEVERMHATTASGRTTNRKPNCRGRTSVGAPALVDSWRLRLRWNAAGTAQRALFLAAAARR
jgi:ketosteroid isomerase-like protein